MMVRLLGDFGFDVVLLETVGAGQGDTAVRQLADVLVLLVRARSGVLEREKSSAWVRELMGPSGGAS